MLQDSQGGAFTIRCSRTVIKIRRRLTIRGRTTPCWKNSGPLAVEPSAVRTDMSILIIRGGLNKYQSRYDYTIFCFAKGGMADTCRSNSLSIYMGSCGKEVYGEGGAIENRPRVDGRWKGGV